uniref:Uncharacterized protein n=1 Tax=Vitis vinifera TaxID=29760 RepID=F6HSG8_VITVI
MQALSASLVQSGKVVTWERGLFGQLSHEDMDWFFVLNLQSRGQIGSYFHEIRHGSAIRYS